MMSPETKLAIKSSFRNVNVKSETTDFNYNWRMSGESIRLKCLSVH